MPLAKGICVKGPLLLSKYVPVWLIKYMVVPLRTYILPFKLTKPYLSCRKPVQHPL